MLTRTTDPVAPINLAHVAPFRLCEVEVQPATRQLIRGGAQEALEPRVMQVLVALAQAKGAVVTRDELIDLCWDGRIVSENAINRVISRIRQVASDFAIGSFRLETITKVRYRLRIDESDEQAQPTGPVKDVRKGGVPTVGRRWLLGGVAVVAAGLITTIWRQDAPEEPSRAARALYDKGVEVRGGGTPSNAEQAIAYLKEATRLAPEFADAWGALALAYRDSASWPGADRIALLARSRAAADRSLRLDPDNLDAAQRWSCFARFTRIG